jgi:hypothetical protein
MDSPSEFFGGCLCGAVRYACTAKPLAMVNCHCRDCQRAGGGAFSPTIIVPAPSLRMTRGQPKLHSVDAESGNEATRAYCGECGSQLYAFSSGRSEFVGIKAGSLDDPSWYRPTKDVWVGSAQPWDCLDPTLPKLRKDR